MNDLGRMLVIAGVLLLLVGLVIIGLPRLGINVGKLPGDFQFNNGSLTCLVPLGTSILLSILLTLGLNILIRFLNR
jgi:hypothetical protein